MRDFFEKLGLSGMDAIPDLSREYLINARREIEGTPVGTALRSLCIRLLAESWKVAKRREWTEKANRLANAVEEYLDGGEEARRSDLRAALDAFNTITDACLDQTMDAVQAIRKAREEDAA